MKKRKIVGSAILGNIVEYYDFGIYAVFATKIGEVFFASSDPFIQTLLALSVFAVGFLMRPLGGFFFGHIGDRFGRKVALTISIIGMAACTFLIGILPSYAQIGIAAPIILVIIRLFQGLCVGGESAGVAIFILEHLEGYKPGLIGGIVMASNMVGTLLAYFVGMGIHSFCGDSSFIDCWRYGFILGGFMGLIGLYMRSQLHETPRFASKKANNEIEKRPLFKAFQKHWQRMIVVMFLGGVTSAVAYTIRGYLKTYFETQMLYTEDQAIYFTTIGLFIMIVFMPIFGIVGDKVGYRKFFYGICYIVMFTIVPIYGLLASPDDVSSVILGMILLGLVASAICAPAYPYAIQAFEVELRYSGVAFSWNMGLALFGGTTPAISAMLCQKYGTIAPAYYLVALSLAFITISYMTRRHKL
jgi:MHS family proline/betaine transporter-like MFS transporter